MENAIDDISSEKHFETSKINKGSYLYLELFIFVCIVELNFMTKSL
jgi:hypothetical protein